MDLSAYHLAVTKKEKVLQEPFHLFLQKQPSYGGNDLN